jgi:hypothetical protein
MMLKVEMSDMADLMKSITDYEYMANTFTQLTSAEEREPLQKFWNEKIVKRDKDTWMKPEEYKYWREINFHVIKQTWGNTSGGWQGIGGSAMTNRYTVIIENQWFGFSCIYYGGKLAYICEMDDKYKVYVEKGYRGLPGCSSCRKDLTVIYKSK